jgi:hypothetical protein
MWPELQKFIVQVERYSPSIGHTTNELAALRFATAKTTSKLKYLVNEIEGLTTIDKFSTSGTKWRRECRSGG